MSHVDDLTAMLWNKVLWWLQHKHQQDLAHVTGALPANTVPTRALVPGSVTPAKLAAGGTLPGATKAYFGDGTWQVPGSTGGLETFKVVFTNAGNVALRGDGAIVTARI